ncbi:hypothetical protein NC796_04265 [Aliifodinibius sp. S!AR15-10]|uniref:hypothetical protein n=1 Tax=Aliifodinibius sp. S!AR15-10 TaxID=2950437 RepID=UPI00285A523B|nr:hypothetical protein [Aliifodinibius sp. S!AR15-10]MDR8390343.1 hypothetical protein [Aliifodinibius sp. S!AR15-10]
MWGNISLALLSIFLLLIEVSPARAQFVDHFEDGVSQEWNYHSGDGAAKMDFTGTNGYAKISVDATKDRDNIWWALIRRNVAPYLNLEEFNKPDRELRVDTRIKASHAPRRVNLHFNTQKTTDFHTHLMEYDIPDTTGWHTISMTTEGFEAVAGDTINAQMALIDWGLETYQVQVDYFRVDVVDTDTTGPDPGNPVAYHPPVPDLSTFEHKANVAHDAMVNLAYPDKNFNGWYSASADERIPALTVSDSQYVILRWDFTSLSQKEVEGYGVLELTTRSLQRMDTDPPEFGQVRIVEILTGAADWNQETVTLSSLSRGKPLNEVFNPQMIIDTRISGGNQRTTRITISKPALQRLVSGQTIGFALRPLGPINASFYSSEYADGAYAPALYFNTK